MKQFRQFLKFDIFNSSSFNDKFTRNPFRCTEDQTNIISDMIEMMSTSRIGSHKCLLPFQFGVILSSMSLCSLYNEIKTKFNVEYLFTSRLNQHVLEHFFVIIRQMGAGYTHICPVTFKYRLKSFVLCHRNVLVSSHPNSKLNENIPSTSNLLRLKQCSANLENTTKITKIVPNPDLTSDAHCLTSVLGHDIGIGSSNDESFLFPEYHIPHNEKYAMQYFRGYVVRKYASKYPYLKETKDINGSND